jgi:hypothetical protein
MKKQQSDRNSHRDSSINELDAIESRINKNIATCDKITGRVDKELTEAREAAAAILADAEARVKAFLADAETNAAKIKDEAVAERSAANGPLRRRQEFLRAEVRRTVASCCSAPLGVAGSVDGARPFTMPLVNESEVPPFAPRYVKRGGRLLRVVRGR